MTWMIVHEPDDTFTVFKNGRVHIYEDDLEMALREVKSAGAKSVTIQEKDGYRRTERV